MPRPMLLLLFLFFFLFVAIAASSLLPAEEPAAPPSEVISRVAGALSAGEPPRIEEAHRELERVVFEAGRPGAEAERKAVAQAIAERAGSDLPVPARIWLLRSLEAIGKGESVPILARLLGPENDPAIREGARRALEANPHVNAKRSLREALAVSDGKFRLALIRSIGARRDPLATGPLLEAAGEKDLELKLAALEALAAIGDISAVPVLESALGEVDGDARAAVERAYLRLADSLARGRERGSARRIYDRAMGMSRHSRCAALVGFARAGLQMATDRIVASLDDPDPQVRGAGLEAAALMPGEGMTKALVARLHAGGEESAPGRLGILHVLSRRGDPGSIQAVLDASLAHGSLADSPPAARAAALGLLSRAAKDGTLPADASPKALAAALAALEAGGEPGAAAEALLAALPEEAITESLIAAAGERGPPSRREAVVRVLGARGAASALPAIQAAAGDASPAVRVAAIEALGRIGDPSSAPILIELIETIRGESPERSAAEGSLARLRGPQAQNAIEEAAKEARGAALSSLVRVLGRRRSPTAPTLLITAATGQDPAARAAALEALGRIPHPDALRVLLDAVEKGEPADRAAAMKGALRQAGSLRGDRAGEAARIYLAALGAAGPEEEIRIALQGLAEIGGPPALERILPLLEKGPLRRDAGRAALRIAERLHEGAGERLPEERREDAKAIYRRILEADPDDATARQATRRLRRLGVDVDPKMP